MKKQRGRFKYIKKNNLFFLFLPKAVFEHTCISTLPHSCTVVKQYKELTTKILSITFLILEFFMIHLGDHGVVNVLISLLVISQLLIKLLHFCLEDLFDGLLCVSVYHLILREIFIHSNGSSVAPYRNSRLMSSQQTRIIRGSIVAIFRICRENTSCDILETDRPGIDGKCSENVFPQLRNTVHGSNPYFVDQITRETDIGQ
jgi:hypothetical protein